MGILPAHWFFGAFFTATSMIGFIALAGIMVRNSVLLIDFMELARRGGATLDAGQEGLPNTIKPIRVVGTLRVKEVKEEESDIVWAIYSMDDAEAIILDY